MKLYLKPKFEKSKIPIYYDTDGGTYLLSSLGVNSAVIYRKFSLRDDGAILFYGMTYTLEDVEIVEDDPPPKVFRYA